MRVIGHTADQMHEHFFFLANTGHVGPQSRLKFSWDRRPSLLGAEDDVHDILRVGVRHVPRLRRSSGYITRTLGRWASCAAPPALRVSELDRLSPEARFAR